MPGCRDFFYLENKNYESLFQYFFDLYIVALTKGKGTNEFERTRCNFPILDADTNGNVHLFLDQGTLLLKNGYNLNALSFLLDNLFIQYTDKDTSVIQCQLMNLSKYLIKDFYNLDIEILMDISVLWNKNTKILAQTYFYPQLPIDLQKKF